MTRKSRGAGHASEQPEAENARMDTRYLFEDMGSKIDNDRN